MEAFSKERMFYLLKASICRHFCEQKQAKEKFGDILKNNSSGI